MPDVVILDGSHDWLSLPPWDLFTQSVDCAEAGAETDTGRCAAEAGCGVPILRWEPRVVTRVKADQTCSAVAAASVIAKVCRDALMRDLGNAVPGFGWTLNKGYSSPEHIAALQAG